MKYYKEIQLKNGSACLLRNPGLSDAEAIIELMRVTSGETYNMLRYPDEISMTSAEEGQYLDALEKSADAIMVSAVLDGKIVGNGGVNPVSKLEKCRHRGEFGISIKKDFWSLGIGGAILAACVESARAAGYEQLELDVVAGNDRAAALYKSFGFEVCGARPRAFRRRDGGYDSLILMTLFL